MRSTPRAGTTTTPAAMPTRPAQARRQARRNRRHGRDRRSGGAASRPVCQATLRVPAHAVVGGHARQHAHRSRLGEDPATRLAGGAQTQLPQLVTVCRGGLRRTGSGVRLLDRTGPQHDRPDRHQPEVPPPWGSRRSCGPGGRGLPDHGAAAAARSRAGRRPRHSRDAEAVLPLPVQTTVFERRRTCRRSTCPT